jgi:[NiFe] hydrogenase diaphorase moiety large subunit
MSLIKSNYVSKLSFLEVSAHDALKAAASKTSQQILDEITNSKLRGCGGAGFPAGLKLTLLAKESATPKYIVCNADEGEPGTFKDRELLSCYAGHVFCGMVIAGLATGATQGIMYLRSEYNYMRDHLEDILTKMHNEHFLGKNILGKNGVDFDITIRMGAGAYVCGEETSLIESLEGKRGEPRNRPPFPIQEGYTNKPTSVNNVETFAWITAIMQKGASWFNKVGTEKSFGYKLFSVSGDCKQPGIYEFPMGTTVADLLKAVGGEDAKAVQMGGFSGQLIPKSGFNRKIAFEDVPPSGSVIVYGPNRDALDIVENYLEFFVEESCGQCTPCRKGNPKLLEGVKLMKIGKCSKELQNELVSLCSTMQLASKCALGQSSPNAFLALVKDFVNEIEGK